MPRFLSTSSTSLPAAPPPQAVTLESDFVVILAALLCAVICVVGLLAVARCAWLRRAPGGLAGRAGPVSGAQQPNKGLKKKVLQQLPKFTYGGDGAAPPPKMGSECAICLGEFAEGDEIRALPQCGHVFHVGCIDTWLGSHSSCPSCRQILVVARCHKCGLYPAISDQADQLKTRQDHNYHSAPAPAAPDAPPTTSCSGSNGNSISHNNSYLP